MKSILILPLIVSSLAMAEQNCPYTVSQTYQRLHDRFGEAVSTASSEKLAIQEELTLGQVGATDDDVSYLCSLKNLKRLSIYNDGDRPKMKGKTLEALAQLPQLEYLDLDANEISGVELFRLRGANKLKTFKLGMGNPLGNAGVESLDDLPGLTTLILQSDDLKPEDMAWVMRSRKTWSSIHLFGNAKIDNSALEILSKGKVIKWDLSGTGIHSAENFEFLTENDTLKSLTLPPMEKEIAQLVIQKLSKSKSLEELDMNLDLDTEIFKELRGATNLKSLTFNKPFEMPEETLVSRIKDLQDLGIQQLGFLVDPRELFGPKRKELCQTLMQEFPKVNFSLFNSFGNTVECRP